ncbi:MAG TPA: SpoIIE family protein phosphatase [Rectinemataceae bacterium]|nr:SpoIIE family protein phosphatase [Rectinemataceae bacterium]
MDLAGIARAIGGPELVKLSIALILIIAFSFWQRMEAEGVMRRFIIVAALALLRDVLSLIYTNPGIYIAGDLIILGVLAFAFGRPLGNGIVLVAASGGAILAGLLAAVFAVLGGGAWQSSLFLIAGLAPVGILFFYGSGRKDVSAGQGGRLIRAVRLPLALASLLYLVAEAFVAPSGAWFQFAIVSAWYGAIALVGFLFVDILRKDLVNAVGYYEESVDSLYDLFTATGSVIKSGFSLQEVLDGLIGVAVERTGADGGVVLLTEEFEEVVAVRALQGRFPPPYKLPESLPRDEERVTSHLRHARFRMGEGLFGELAREGSSLLVPDALADPRLPSNGDDDWLRLRSLMVAPLQARDQVIGLVAVARIGEDPFSERDFDRLKLLASFGAISVSDAFTFLEAAERGDIDREAAIAEEIQRTVIPRKLPEIPGYNLGVFTSSARGVCSDYYDVINVRGGRSLLVFGDVAGKGVSAGLVMVMVRSILHLIVHSTKDAATLMSWVNRGLSGKIDMDHFSTLSMLFVEAEGGDMEYVNAAHQPLVIYRKASDSLESIDIKSIPIGVERSTEYASRRIKLGPGDILLLYSDGVIEAMNEQGRQFGRKNLGNALLRVRELGAREIAEAIKAELEEFAGATRRHDDQTVLVIKARSR